MDALEVFSLIIAFTFGVNFGLLFEAAFQRRHRNALAEIEKAAAERAAKYASAQREFASQHQSWGDENA